MHLYRCKLGGPNLYLQTVSFPLARTRASHSMLYIVGDATVGRLVTDGSNF